MPSESITCASVKATSTIGACACTIGTRAKYGTVADLLQLLSAGADSVGPSKTTLRCIRCNSASYKSLSFRFGTY